MSHILVVGNGPQPADSPLPIHLREVSATPQAWRLQPARIGGFPYTPLDALMTEAGLVDAVLSNVTAGTRAVLIDTFGEYGLLAMRSAVTLPVVGSAESALAEARSHGERFGIVTVWPASLDWLYQRQLRQLDATGRCVGIRYVGGQQATPNTPGDTMGALQRGDDGWAARLAAAIGELAAAGADSIVFGCTCMAPVWARLQQGAALPLICAARAGARAAVRAAQQDSPGIPGASQASLRTLRDFAAWSERGAAAVPPSDDASCPVCIADAE